MESFNFQDYVSQNLPELIKKHDVPGAAVLLIENGEISSIITAGYEDISKNKRLTKHTLFCICSISKSITAWLVMKLVEEGQLDLDTPVEKYLTRWHIPPSEWDDNEITLRRLLSHTAGISIDGTSGLPPEYEGFDIVDYLNGETIKRMDERQKKYRNTYKSENFTDRVERFEPVDQRMLYSGGGYAIIDLIIEEVMQQPFPEVATEKILHPLGMQNTFFNFTPNFPKSEAIRYDKNGEPYPNYRHINYAAGGFYSTMEDLGKFTIATINQDFLRPESYQAMYDLIVREENPLGFDSFYALGHSVMPMGEIKVINHSGGHPGTRTFFLAIPALKKGMCIFFNSDNANPLQELLLLKWGESLGIKAPNREN